MLTLIQSMKQLNVLETLEKTPVLTTVIAVLEGVKEDGCAYVSGKMWYLVRMPTPCNVHFKIGTKRWREREAKGEVEWRGKWGREVEGKVG